MAGRLSEFRYQKSATVLYMHERMHPRRVQQNLKFAKTLGTTLAPGPEAEA